MNIFIFIILPFVHCTAKHLGKTSACWSAVKNKDDFACSSLNMLFVCPPGVSSERHCEQGFTSEGLRV